jgi:hypothetical protein
MEPTPPKYGCQINSGAEIGISVTFP